MKLTYCIQLQASQSLSHNVINKINIQQLQSQLKFKDIFQKEIQSKFNLFKFNYLIDDLLS
jgi:hypothetical protein